MTWELICGDSFKVMPKLVEANMKFDLIVLDPPYLDCVGRFKMKKINYARLAFMVRRLLKDEGVIVLFGKQPQLINDWKYFERYFDMLHEFVLIKANPTPSVGKTYPLLSHENVWILKLRNCKVSDTKIDYTRGVKVVEIMRKKTKYWIRIRREIEDKFFEYPRYEDRMKTVIMRGQVTPDDLEYVGHPTQKPLMFLRKIIVATTEEGDLVLDPFAGSGTTLVAAIIERRNVVGIEIKPEFCEIIRKRCMQAERGITKWLEQ